MKTLHQLAHQLTTIPLTTSWYLSDLGEARGKQELFTKQAPQKLKVLREHALIESAISSNRIEGVVIDQARVGTVVFGKSRLRDRGEEEIRGYRRALQLMHEQGAKLPLSEATMLRLHKLSHAGAGDAGQYKTNDSDIIETQPDGRVRVRFKTVTAKKTPAFMREMIPLWDDVLLERRVPPLIALAAMNLDFLCIHPFRDGNGRASQLLLLLQSYHLGFEVGRYISLERLIEENKDRYYETLEQSSQGWHEGKHDAWPYINFVLFILKDAYKEFESRVGQIASPRGAKTELIQSAIHRTNAPFRIADIQRECPGVSLDMIRQVLKNLRAEGQVACLGMGPQTKWVRIFGSQNDER
jgi:Fic family protein